MDIDTRHVFAVVGALVASHVLYRYISSHSDTQQLPPRYPSVEPFLNLDWKLPASLDPRKYCEYQELMGKTYRLSTLFNPLGRLVTSDPDNIQTILSGKDWGNQWRLEPMREMMGAGLITTDGEEWMRARKMMRPAFARSNYDDFEVVGKVADEILEKIEQDGGEADMQALLTHVVSLVYLYFAAIRVTIQQFTSTSMQFILGLDPGSEDDGRPMSASKFGELWFQGLLGMALRLSFQTKSWLLPKAPHRRVCAALHSFVNFAIDRSEERNRKTTDTDSKKSMVDVLLPKAHDKEDARNQLMQTLLATQDTTLVLTCNAIQILAERSDLWMRLREELQAQGRDLLTYDGLKGNTLVQNILMETIRIRPVFHFVVRRALCDTTLRTGGGPPGDQPFPVPTGTAAFVNFWSLNLDPAVFGPDPHVFNPDRWNAIKPKPKEFMPFGIGPRACLGKDKALADSGYLLMRLVERFERVESRVSVWKPRATISMRNTAGYKVAFSQG